LSLLHILKDLPSDLPRDVDDVVQVLVTVLHLTGSNANLDVNGDNAVHAQNNLVPMVGIFFPELQSWYDKQPRIASVY
jgi:transformation/transcription domain-associated protein